MINKKPKYSIVLCTLNGARKIEKSINSLLDQDFPKDKYEIIVVIDGSTDNTFQVISKFPIKIVRNKERKGVPYSRNVGLKNSTGEIIICFDDDCTASKNWLSKIDRFYNDKKVMGVGSILSLSSSPTLTDEYCFNAGYANPVPTTLGKSSSILVRFISYLVTNFTNPQSRFIDGSTVFELPGAMSSFRKKLIVEIGGWNNKFIYASEDLDLCRRLKKANMDKKFVVVPSAKVVHEQDLSFLGFIKKEFKRGATRKLYYNNKNEVPPYFPAPIIYIALLPIIILNFWIGLILLPFLLYPWWIPRAIKENNIKMLFFPFMQLLHEGATVIGMLKI